MKNIPSLFLLLLACAAPATGAASTLVASYGDLILGFQASGGTGAATNLEVDLGSIAQFSGLPANTTFTIGGLSVQDLIAVFGSDWNTRDDLTWGIAGTTGATQSLSVNGTTIAAKTLWGSRAETTAGVQSTPWTRGSTFAQQGPANTISSLYLGPTGSLNGKTSTTNSLTAAALDNTVAGSWTQQEGATPAAFGYFNGSFNNGVNFSTIVGTFAVSDLYQLQPGSGAATYVGSFGLNSAGLLEFSNSFAVFGLGAVPEPATDAVLAGALVLGFGLVRRRRAGGAAPAA